MAIDETMPRCVIPAKPTTGAPITPSTIPSLLPTVRSDVKGRIGSRGLRVCIGFPYKHAIAGSGASLFMPDHAQRFFGAIGRISTEIDAPAIDRLAGELAALRQRGGRL